MKLKRKKFIYYFENNKTDTCNKSYYRDGRDKKEVTFTHEKSVMYKTNIVFDMCSQFFVYNPEKHSKEIVEKYPLEYCVNIDYLINLWDEKYLNSSKKTLFKKIYFLEKIDNNEYVKYEVSWTEMHINKY